MIEANQIGMNAAGETPILVEEDDRPRLSRRRREEGSDTE